MSTNDLADLPMESDPPMRTTPLPAPYLAFLAALLGAACGVAGGYGGAWLRTRQLRSELDQTEADHIAFDLRIKKFEGRETRARQTAGGAIPRGGDAELLLALQSARPRAVADSPDNEAELLQRAFPAMKKAGE